MSARSRIKKPLAAAALFTVLGATAVYLLNVAPASRQSRDAEIQLARLHEAVSAYHIDHGFYPGSRQDFGYPLSDALLREKLLQYTDAGGQSSPTQSHRFRYGPYLDEFPTDPIFGSRDLSWALGEASAFAPRQEGGWIYAPERGEFVARIDGLQDSRDLAGF
ncbi:MAG TPA: hypothetical protein VGB13_06335 [Candidatus Krumholzibacteria bacterium]